MGSLCSRDESAPVGGGKGGAYHAIGDSPATGKSVPRYKDPSYDPSGAEVGGGAGAGGDTEDERFVSSRLGGREADGRDSLRSVESHKKRTLRPAKEHKKGTRRAALHERLRSTFSKGTVNLEDFVKLPEGEDPNEWIAVHVIDFYNDISLLYGTISELCTPASCPVMSAGSKYTYLWADGVTITTPIKVPAREYVEYLMAWVDEQISNEEIFPVEVGTSFRAEFVSDMRTIFKRLFRVYAHMYRSHFKQFQRLGVEQHLHMCFKRFVFFILEFDMVDMREMAPLRTLVDKIKSTQ